MSEVEIEIDDFEEGDLEVEAGGDPGEEERSAEDVARQMGWKPKDQYKGEAGWIDAREFLERAENNPAFLKRTLHEISRNYTKIEKGMAALVAHRDREVEMARSDGYRRAEEELKREYRSAVEEGDVEAAEAAWDKRARLAPKKAAGVTPEERQEWLDRNGWFASDPYLAEVATKHADYLASKGVSDSDQLAQTEAYIREPFPQKFGRERTAPRIVRGGDRNNVRQAARKGKPGTYEGLNQKARNSCDSFVRSMAAMGKNEAAARAEWLGCADASFFEQE